MHAVLHLVCLLSFGAMLSMRIETSFTFAMMIRIVMCSFLFVMLTPYHFAPMRTKGCTFECTSAILGNLLPGIEPVIRPCEANAPTPKAPYVGVQEFCPARNHDFIAELFIAAFPDGSNHMFAQPNGTLADPGNAPVIGTPMGDSLYGIVSYGGGMPADKIWDFPGGTDHPTPDQFPAQTGQTVDDAPTGSRFNSGRELLWEYAAPWLERRRRQGGSWGPAESAIGAIMLVLLVIMLLTGSLGAWCCRCAAASLFLALGCEAQATSSMPSFFVSWYSVPFWAVISSRTLGKGFRWLYARVVHKIVTSNLVHRILSVTLSWEFEAVLGERWQAARCHSCDEDAPRATVRVSQGSYFTKFKFRLLLFIFLPCTAAVCKICGGFFSGCTGGTDGVTCQGSADVKKNAAALVAGSATALTLVGMFKPRVTRVFNATVLSLLKTYASMPVAGTPYDFSGKSHSEVVKALIAGKVSKAEVQIHFSECIDTASAIADADERAAKLASIEANVNLLSTVVEGASTSSSSVPLAGVYHFIWGKCSEVVLVKSGKVTVGTEKAKNAATSTIHTPTTADQFYEIVDLFQAMVVQVGLAPYMVCFNLIQEAVWTPVRERQQSWMLAHEILLVYLDKVDQSVGRTLTLANVYQSGEVGVDATKSTAITNAHARFGKHFSDIFRPSGGTRAPSGDLIVHNGKSNAKSNKPCAAWNFGNIHRQDHMESDGACKFRHACSQWITMPDGSVGFCFRNHKKGDCDRRPDERSTVGPAKT